MVHLPFVSVSHGNELDDKILCVVDVFNHIFFFIGFIKHTKKYNAVDWNILILACTCVSLVFM